MVRPGADFYTLIFCEFKIFSILRLGEVVILEDYS